MSAVVASSPVALASSITYLPFGPMTGLTYGNSLTFSATYDQDYNPTNRTVSTIYNHTYDTDDNGNIIQIGTPTFGYDALNRVNAETPGSVGYTYDATSNRLTKVSGGTTTTTVPGTSNKISAVGGTSYTYDAAGNITAIGGQAYAWNAAGQLATVNTTGGVYTYDSQNRRVKKVAGGNTIHYVYGLDGLLYGEYNNSGVMIREYVYLDDAPLAQVDAGSPEVPTYLHTDHLGTPRFGTNSGGTQVWTWASDAFGVGAPSGAATVNLRMPGQYYDSESGLFYNWNRYYNPATGRYISSDPIGIDGGLNTFLYAEASPVMYSDPEGLWVAPLVSCAVTAPCRTVVVQGVRTAAPYVVRTARGAIVLWNAASDDPDEEVNLNTPTTIPQVCMAEEVNNESAEEQAKRCEEGLERDLETCSEVAKREGKAYYKICEQQAMLRYSNCLAGRDTDAPLPPWRL